MCFQVPLPFTQKLHWLLHAIKTLAVYISLIDAMDVSYQAVLLVLSVLIVVETTSETVANSSLNDGQLQLIVQRQQSSSNKTQVYCIAESVRDRNCSERGTCPPWFTCANTGKCKCGPSLRGGIKCSEKTMRSAVLNCHCVTYNETEANTFAGLCFYNCERPVLNKVLQNVYHGLPENTSDLNSYMCSRFNRTGVLCGECVNGQSPFVLSYNLSCVNCPNSRLNWLKFIAVGFIPLTLFYFVMLFFNINVTSSHMHGYVLFSQAISTPALVRILLLNIEGMPFVSKVIKFIEPFFSSWNLDFFRSTIPDICLNIDNLQAFSLDYCVAIYPLVLITTSYLLIKLYDRNIKFIVYVWKPFRFFFKLFRQNWDVRTSVIDSFATFFLLSYVKVLSISTDLLIFTSVIELPSRKVHYRLYYSASVKFFHRDHVPYAVLAVSFIVFFIMIPTLILVFYPFHFFQKCLSYYQIRWHFLHAFVDSFQGYYKDGTEPKTWDLRWFSAYGFILRICVCFIFNLTLSSMYFVYAVIILVSLTILLVNLDPYKEVVKHYTVIDAFFIIFLSIIYISFLGINVVDIQAHEYKISFLALSVLATIVPIIYVSVITLHWIYSRKRWGKQLLLSIKYHTFSYCCH